MWRRGPASPVAPPLPRIPRVTRLMALAIKFQDMVDRGEATVEEAQDAAYKQTGPLWERAMQAEAAARAPCPEVMTNLAVALMASGNRAEANQLLEAALRYNASYDNARRAGET